MDADLPVQIPMRCIIEHFNCSICLELLKNTAMTPCGHRFCKECIDEFVDRRTRCPCCNATTRASDLIHDHQTDEFLASVESEKERAISSYMDTIFARSASEVAEGEGQAALSPFESVLRKHLKKSLSAHETYLLNLKLDCQRNCARLGNDADHEANELKKAAGNSVSQKLEDVARRCEQLQEGVRDKLKKISDLLAQSFDRYLEDNLPNPSILPVPITLSVPSKNFSATDVTLSVADSFEDLVEKLQQLMADAGQRVSSIEDGYRLSLIGPFAGDVSPDTAEASAATEETAAATFAADNGIALARDCRPLLQYGVKPHSEIRLLGKVVLESELPKKCLAVSFQKGDVIDYFTCHDCDSNWICKNCALACHKGHKQTPYILGHIPRWACCYCSKKIKKCIL